MATKRDQQITMNVERALGRAYAEGFDHGVEVADEAMRMAAQAGTVEPGLIPRSWVLSRFQYWKGTGGRVTAQERAWENRRGGLMALTVMVALGSW